MTIKIIDAQHHTLIKSIKGLAYWDIFEGFVALMRESNKGKHAIWQIEDGPTNFSVGDFSTTMKLIQDRYRFDSRQLKIAFVIESDFHYSIMNAFIVATINIFGTNIKAFRTFEPAQQWIVSG